MIQPANIWLDWQLLGLLENSRSYALVLGVIGIITGFLLLNAHQRVHFLATRNEENQRVKRFESRKFRRRATVAAMVSATGCLLAALYWVTEIKVLAIFVLLILGLLIGILGIALFDMFSVSLQTLTRDDSAERKKFVEEYLRKREQAASEKNRDDQK